MAGRKVTCCRSTPRCRSCPLVIAGELKAIRALAGEPRPAVAPHLDGVPECLHKYEPLLRRAWDERQTSGAAAAPPA